MLVPAICNECGVIVAVRSPLAGSRSSVMEDCWIGPCPSCRSGNLRILDHATDETGKLHLLQRAYAVLRPLPDELLGELDAVLRNALDEKLSGDQIADAISEQTPAAAIVGRWIKDEIKANPLKTVALFVLALISVLSLIRGCEAKDRPDTLPPGVVLPPDIAHV